MTKMKLKEIAHSRAGDKGNISNISVIAYDPNHFEIIKREVTVEKVREQFKGLVQGDIERYALPNVYALNFVLHEALGGGVTKSLALDRHGKSYCSAMLEMQIDM